MVRDEGVTRICILTFICLESYYDDATLFLGIGYASEIQRTCSFGNSISLNPQHR